MAAVTFEDVSRAYPGSIRPAVDHLRLEVADGEFLVLVGPSGCGKSTSLRMLAGLEPLDSGAIRIGGRDVTAVQPKDRDIAMVFQNYALYPHMSVADNIGFALRVTGRPKAEIAERVGKVADLLDLSDQLGRKPQALSGGQRQRVAMGRAIIREPSVFLMDEPLSNLDAKLRVQTRAQIAALQRRLGTTTVYVTHDQVEAMTMGDRVAVLRDGLLQQVGTPRELYDRPVNVFVAGFLGSPAMNLLPVRLAGESIVLWGVHHAAPGRLIHDLPTTDSPDVLLGIRPEDVALGVAGDGPSMTVSLVEELGADAYIHGHVKGLDASVAGHTSIVLRAPSRSELPRAGDTVCARLDLNHAYLFRSDTGARLGP